MEQNLKVAFVQDALPFWGGAENVLAAALEVIPQAEVYALVYRDENFSNSIIARRPVHTSFIDRLPAARSHHRAFLPLMPLAIERFDLHDYDILVSFSYAVAHGILPRPGQLHISYMHTPLRYAWQKEGPAISRGQPVIHFLHNAYLRSFRKWDAAAARRTDRFVAVSQWIAQRIWQAYQRPSDVLYPPVDVDRFRPLYPRADYYLVVSRLVAHKRIDLVVEAFSRSGLPLLVVGAGPEESRLWRMAGPNVRLLGWQPSDRLAELYGRARGFIHAGVEDFGIAMVEAQAAGCPVIARQAGSAPEIVRPGETGLLFSEPTVEGLRSTVERFDADFNKYDPRIIQENARRFGKARFQFEFNGLVEREWNNCQSLAPSRGATAAGSRAGQQSEPISRQALEGKHGI